MSKDAKLRVGILVDPNIVNESNFFRGVLRYAQSHNWRIVGSEEVLSLSKSGLKSWEGNGLLGFMRDPQFVAAVKRAKIPAVNSARIALKWGLPNVILDTVTVGRMVAQYFLQRGFRHFAWCVSEETLSFDTKLKGFSERLSEAGFSCEVISQPVTLPEDRTWAQNRAVLMRHLSRLPKPLAMGTHSDQIAVRVMGACETGHMRVPQDVAVMGYGNDGAICLHTRPALSSIGIDFESVGLQAAPLLERLMHGDRDVPDTAFVAPRAVTERGSTDVIVQSDSDLAKALDYIERHACDPVEIEDVLRHTGMSRRNLERLFQRHLHRSPNTEIARVRVRRAQQLLAETQKPLSEIAAACGFAKYRGLSAAFKRIAGITPQAYRKRLP